MLNKGNLEEIPNFFRTLPAITRQKSTMIHTDSPTIAKHLPRLIHSEDPQLRHSSDYSFLTYRPFCMSVRLSATVGISVRLAEGITDDTCLVLLHLKKFKNGEVGENHFYESVKWISFCSS